ncbi:MAG: transglutaminase domain-containing protein [Clostridia bacterium]|nr:transglutaminase domain-containing protein [Clostridia bacterium]
MNSNKIAVAVLILAFVVIVSSLFAASVTEPLFPETAESEASVPHQAETSDTDHTVENTPVQSETESSPADQTSSESVSEEPSAQPSVDESESFDEASDEEPSAEPSEEPEAPSEEPQAPSEEPDEEPSEEPEESVPEEQPEESSEEELIRDPLGKPGQDEPYKVTVIVKDIEGFTIEGAEVSIDDQTGETDEMGKFYIELDSADFVLNVKSGAFVSYYEEVTLYDKNSVIEISLARADKIRRLLNSAVLHPYVADHPELDAAVKALFDELFEPGMDTYDKVKACYDWVIDNTSYKRPSHEKYNDLHCAYQLIRDGIGTCDCYSNAFAVMMRYIGLECYVVEGTTSANGGGYTGHEWTTIKIGEDFYVFDPQVEDAIAGRNGGKVNYLRFCLPEPHSKYRYSVCSRQFFVDKFDKYLLENGHYVEE